MSGLIPDTKQSLSVLLTQLAWPSGLVRERACVEIAKLLNDEKYARATRDHLLEWMSSQRLESVCALGLLPLLRARIDRPDSQLPSLPQLQTAIAKPSLLSTLLLSELAAGNGELLSPSLEHSGETPSDFDVDPFFEKYVKTFVPPYYDYLAGLIEENEVIAFRRHWAFEWKGLVDETSVELTDRTLYFWFGSRDEKERVAATDTKLSEIYRSAFLRSLAWAVATEKLNLNGALLFAAQTCPVNLDLWKLKVNEKPDWFPRVEEPTGTIDTIPAQIWHQVEELWKGQLSSEWRILETSGMVLEGESIYDLQIQGLFQKSHGPAIPNLENVFNWCHDEVQLSAGMDGHLRFSGAINQERNKEWIRQFDDWSFAPAAGNLNGNSFARWQYWRLQRQIWLPTPFLGSRLRFNCSEDNLNVYEGDDVVGKWFDWLDGLTERYNVKLPMPTGQCLQIRAKTIDDFAKATGSSFCWICRLTTYYRKDTLRPYQEIQDFRDYGCTRISTD